MRVVVNVREFVEALKKVLIKTFSGDVSARGDMRIEAVGSKLLLSTQQYYYNYEVLPGEDSPTGEPPDVEVRSSISAKVYKPGKVWVRQKHIKDVLRKMKMIDWEEVEIIAQGDSITVMVHEALRYIIPMIEPKPERESPAFSDEITLPQGLLKRMIQKTLFATDHSAYLWWGSCCWLVVEPRESDRARARMIATDGSQIAICEEEYQLGTPQEQKVSFLVPVFAALQMARLLEGEEDCLLKFNECENARLSLNGKTVDFLLDNDFGKLPWWRETIPRSPKVSMILDWRDFRDVLARSTKIREVREDGFRLWFDVSRNGCLHIEGLGCCVYEDVHAEVSCEYEWPIMFNGRFILNALNVMDRPERVQFTWSGPLGQALLEPISDEYFWYVLMPLRRT